MATAESGRPSPVRAVWVADVRPAWRPGQRAEVLIERERELDTLAAALAAAASRRGALVLVEGEAGVGKTALLAEAARLARRAGQQVLSARGAEYESELPYGLVRRLLEPRLAAAGPVERAALLAGPARHAADVLEREVAGGNTSAPVLHGLNRFCRNLARNRPLCLIVDDAHWADEPSSRWFGYLARRLESLPIAVLLSLRTGAHGGAEHLVDELTDELTARCLRPARLSERGTSALVRALLDDAPECEYCAQIHALTAGVPLFVRELVLAGRPQAIGPAPAGTPRRPPLAPVALVAAVRRQTRQLGLGAVELARAVAVLGGGRPLGESVAVSGLSPDAAARALDRLVAASVLTPGAAPDFVHPIVRIAMYRGIGEGARSRLHARAARALAAAGAADGRVAAHLLATTPAADAQVVRDLRAAAGDEPDSARATILLRRALAEPPPPGDHFDVLRSLAIAEARSLDPGAPDRLAEALRQAPDHAARAQAQAALARFACDPDWLRDARELIAAAQLERADALLAGEQRTAAERGDTRHIQHVAIVRAEIARRQGRLEDAATAAAAALAGLGDVASRLAPLAAGVVAAVLIEQGRLDDAKAALAPYADDACSCVRGELALARDDAGAALAAFAAANWPGGTALALARAGRAEEACRVAAGEVRAARQAGTSTRVAAALRIAAAVAPTAAERIELLREALDFAERSPEPLEHARVLIDLGATLRRTNHRAASRELLRRGLDLAHRHGAAVLAQRAAEELTATGARPQRRAVTGIDALTPGERRVAGLAAHGLSNREIAAMLQISAKTVENHLGRVYRKLDIGSRRRLAEILGRKDQGDLADARRAALADDLSACR